MNDLLNQILNGQLCVHCETADEIRFVKQALSDAFHLPHSPAYDMEYPFVYCRDESRIVGVHGEVLPTISGQEFISLLSGETVEDPPISCMELL